MTISAAADMIIPLALFAPLGSDCTAAVDRFGIECRGGVFWGITSSTVSHPLADPRCPLVAWGGPVLWGKGLMKSILVSEHPPFPIPPLTEAIGATRTAPVASSHVGPPPPALLLFWPVVSSVIMSRRVAPGAVSGLGTLSAAVVNKRWPLLVPILASVSKSLAPAK